MLCVLLRLLALAVLHADGKEANATSGLARALALSSAGERTTAVRRLNQLAEAWSSDSRDDNLVPLALALCRHGLHNQAARLLQRAASTADTRPAIAAGERCGRCCT